MESFKIWAQEDEAIQFSAPSHTHQESDHIYCCVDREYEEGKREVAELWAESRLPHIHVAFLPRLNANRITTASGEATVHLCGFFGLFILWCHSHAVLLLPHSAISRPSIIVILVIQATKCVNV